MANQEHLDLLKQGVETWNQWRREHPEIQPDLSGADLSETFLHGADLREADFRETRFHDDTMPYGILTGTSFIGANLSRANLNGADLTHVNLIGADLSGANLNNALLPKRIISEATLTGAFLREVDLSGVDLSRKDLSRVDFSDADLNRANLSEADLSEANLSGANLSGATFIDTNLTHAILTDCLIYGISAWNVRLEGARQLNLVITPGYEPTITVDNLKIAQFIYLLLNNREIREVINTITSKVVLILGRFTVERKAVLDALRDELRKQNYLPVLFDFEKPASRDLTETVSTLAHMARFVIADITDAKSIPQELMIIVPNLPSVPVQPLVLNSQHEYGMFEHFTRFPWVLPVYHYTDEDSLLQSLKEKVIVPAEQKAKELEKR